MGIIRAWKDDPSLPAPLAVERLTPLTLHRAGTGGRAADALARLGGGCRCRRVGNRAGARWRWKWNTVCMTTWPKHPYVLSPLNKGKGGGDA